MEAPKPPPAASKPPPKPTPGPTEQEDEKKPDPKPAPAPAPAKPSGGGWFSGFFGSSAPASEKIHDVDENGDPIVRHKVNLNAHQKVQGGWDEKLGRFVFDGEVPSDDDKPAPPPPKRAPKPSAAPKAAPTGDAMTAPRQPKARKNRGASARKPRSASARGGRPGRANRSKSAGRPKPKPGGRAMKFGAGAKKSLAAPTPPPQDDPNAAANPPLSSDAAAAPAGTANSDDSTKQPPAGSSLPGPREPEPAPPLPLAAPEALPPLEEVPSALNAAPPPARSHPALDNVSEDSNGPAAPAARQPTVPSGTIPDDLRVRFERLESDNRRLQERVYELEVELTEKNGIILRLRQSGGGGGGEGLSMQQLKDYFASEVMPEFIGNVERNRRGITWLRERAPRLENAIEEVRSQRRDRPGGDLVISLSRTYMVWISVAMVAFYVAYTQHESPVVAELWQHYADVQRVGGNYLQDLLGMREDLGSIDAAVAVEDFVPDVLHDEL